MKLGGNPFRKILHISFFEADFLGVAVPRRADRPSAYPRSGLLGGGSGGVGAPLRRNRMSRFRERLISGRMVYTHVHVFVWLYSR